MRITVCALLLLFATFAVAQQQTPPGSTPPTFPEQQKVPDSNAPPSQPLPPDTNAPPQDRNAQPMSAGEIQQQIQKKLDNEPDLASSHLTAEVSDTSVTLTGSVNSEQQHDLALRIARSYSGDRTIEDKIQVKAGS